MVDEFQAERQTDIQVTEDRLRKEMALQAATFEETRVTLEVKMSLSHSMRGVAATLFLAGSMLRTIMSFTLPRKIYSRLICLPDISHMPALR